MESKIAKSLECFILGKALKKHELKQLQLFFREKNNEEEINNWLINNWEAASNDDVEINFEALKLKIDQHKQSNTKTFLFDRLSGINQYYQRIAAVLFIPLVLGVSIFLFSQINQNDEFYIAEAPTGQKAKLELPDGSKVWLNSDSQIKYSSNFNKKNRIVELIGEAFFEVEKNQGKPFIVKAGDLDVEVTGTRFNVNAYADEQVIETSLVEGKVNLHLKNSNKPIHMIAGNVISYSRKDGKTEEYSLDEEAKIAWTENRLVFINDNFPKLVRKMEKWYNVKVVYNEREFANNKLTAKLFEGEQLDKLLKIIEEAINAECRIEKNIIYITKN